jgi:hypothetical protein
MTIMRTLDGEMFIFLAVYSHNCVISRMIRGPDIVLGHAYRQPRSGATNTRLQTFEYRRSRVWRSGCFLAPVLVCSGGGSILLYHCPCSTRLSFHSGVWLQARRIRRLSGSATAYSHRHVGSLAGFRLGPMVTPELSMSMDTADM